MTLSTTTVKNSYSGNGSTTAFNYTFAINTTAELIVIERSAAGAETVKELGTHYSIADAGSSGGDRPFSVRRRRLPHSTPKPDRHWLSSWRWRAYWPDGQR